MRPLATLMATSLSPMDGRCPRYRCGAPIGRITYRIGALVTKCQACARAAQGLCIECRDPIAKRRRRCDPCQAATVKAREKSRSQKPERKRQVLDFVHAYRATQAGLEATRAACRKYAAAHPLTDLDRKIRRIRAAQRRQKAAA